MLVRSLELLKNAKSQHAYAKVALICRQLPRLIARECLMDLGRSGSLGTLNGQVLSLKP